MQAVNLAYVVASALVIWKVLSVVTNCESPIVVVLTYDYFNISEN